MPVYDDDAAVGRLTRELVATGETVFQVYKMGFTPLDHVKAMLTLFDPPTGAHVLDVGCGIGTVAHMMRGLRSDLRFTLLNLSQAQLDMCPKDFVRLQAKFPWQSPKGPFDALMFNYSIGHMPLDLTMRTAADILTPGGVLFIYDMRARDSHELQKALDYIAYPSDDIRASANRYGLVGQLLEIYGCHRGDFDKVMDREQQEIVFKGVRPVAYRFTKK